jgi:hypothetical protein
MIGRGNRSTRRKPAPVRLRPPQIPHAARTRTRAAAVGSQRLTTELWHGLGGTLTSMHFRTFCLPISYLETSQTPNEGSLNVSCLYAGYPARRSTVIEGTLSQPLSTRVRKLTQIHFP